MRGCMGLQLGAPNQSFVCHYFTVPSLILLVLIRTHCDFNKFHFGFIKKKILLTMITKRLIIKSFQIDNNFFSHSIIPFLYHLTQ